MTFVKGQKKPNQGKRGPDKTNRAIKEMVTGALEAAGGQDYLLQCALNPRLAGHFLSLVAKVLPTQISGAGPNGEHVFSRIVREIVEVDAVEVLTIEHDKQKQVQ